MKKLLTLALSMIMAVSLTVPAFADGPDGPPAEADLGIIGGADGPTAIITTIPGGWANTNPEFDQAYQKMYQAMIDGQKKALGGVPGQIGVMVNGAYIQFPDAAPEMTNGATMVPVRALVEALGGEVEADGGKVVCTSGLTTITFEMNGADVEVEHRNPDGSGEAERDFVTMPVVTYQKDGRTYVPLRFTAQALGCEVGWDSDFQTAILVDRAALAETFDKDFTIMNKVQANRFSAWEKGRTLSTGVKGSVTVTAFDTLNGNKTYQADLSSQTLMNTEAISGSASIKLSDDILDLWIGQYGYMDEEVLERMRFMADALEDMEFIMDREGQMWVHSPVLDELGGRKDIWCGMEMDPAETRTVFVSADTATVGAALASMMSTDSVMMWTETAAMITPMAELFTDGRFTTSGGVSTLTITLDDLAELYPYSGMDELKEFEITLTVDSNGGAALTCKAETKARYGMPAMRITMDCAQDSRGTDLTMTCHVANFGEMKLTLSATQQAAGEEPTAEPPEGAFIVDAAELLAQGGFSSGQ